MALLETDAVMEREVILQIPPSALEQKKMIRSATPRASPSSSHADAER